MRVWAIFTLVEDGGDDGCGVGVMVGDMLEWINGMVRGC